jgi:predicted small secreted protein
MRNTIMTTVLLGALLALSACNTVRGAAADLNSVANCTETAMKRGRC